MQKPAIGVSLPLSPSTLAPAWQEQVFFTYTGLGRQANPAIHASLLSAEATGAGQNGAAPRPASPSPSSQPYPLVRAEAGFECVTLVLRGAMSIRDSVHTDAITCSTGDVLWRGNGRGLIVENSLVDVDAPGRNADGASAQGSSAQVPAPSAQTSASAPGPGASPAEGTASSAPAAENPASAEALQLWINLPQAAKQIDPHRQYLPSEQIPSVALPDEAGSVRIIAGTFQEQLGPAETVAPLQLWDVQLKAGHSASLPLTHRWYAQALVLEGQLSIEHWSGQIQAPQLVAFDRQGDALNISTETGCRLVVLSCEPLDEAIVGREALVFADQAQLQQAEAAVQQGAFGQL